MLRIGTREQKVILPRRKLVPFFEGGSEPVHGGLPRERPLVIGFCGIFSEGGETGAQRRELRRRLPAGEKEAVEHAVESLPPFCGGAWRIEFRTEGGESPDEADEVAEQFGLALRDGTEL